MNDSTVRPRTQMLVSVGLLTYPGLIIAAVFGSAWPFALLGLLSLGTEALLRTWAPAVNWHLTRGGIGWTVRSTARSLAVIVFVATAPGYTHGQFLAIAFGMAVIEGARACYSMATTYARIRRTVPALTRNVDLTALRIPPLRYGPFERVTARSTMAFGVLPLLGIIGSTITTTGGPATIATAIAAVASVAAAATVGIGALRAVVLPTDERLLAEIHQQILAYQPEIVLYFSGNIDSLYQINMWLEVVTALPYRGLIVMRERANVALMAPTSLPVVSVPSGVDLMNFELPSVAVAMYPANTGKNIHFLRVPGMMHVFIGHGDSDKVASVNPFSKAYDEIWVAGPAGRDRWARAAVGVDDADIVEVGRPQLASIRHASENGSGPVFTVLYAPTWEGWTEDAQNTSLLEMGTTIVAKLLAHPLGVRVIYKPHPFTGTRDPKALACSRTIMAMIEQANAAGPTASATGNAVTGNAVTGNAVAGSTYVTAQRLADDLRTRIDAVGHDAHTADDLDAARESGLAHPDYAAAAAKLTREWNQAFWASQPAAAHRSITDPLAALFDCFNHSDLLITDISSVVADYLYSGKPYIVTNSSDLPDQVFRSRYPTAGAAYLLGTDCATLDDVITDLAAGEDPWQAEREGVRTYLLGPDELEPGARFAAAVEQAVGRASKLVHQTEPIGEFDREPEPVAQLSVD